MALDLCDCNTKCRLLLVTYYHVILFRDILFITPPPLMFCWETCELFQTPTEHRRGAGSVCTLLLSQDNLLTGYFVLLAKD